MELNFDDIAPKTLKVQLRDPFNRCNNIVGSRTLKDNFSEVKLNYNNKDELISIEVMNFWNFSVTEVITEKSEIFREN